jgi:hypothetical protein
LVFVFSGTHHMTTSFFRKKISLLEIKNFI